MSKVQLRASTAMPPPSDQRDPVVAFQALTARYRLQVEEWDTATLAENIRDKFMAAYFEIDGKRILVVPAGQDPAERLHAARELAAELAAGEQPIRDLITAAIFTRPAEVQA